MAADPEHRGRPTRRRAEAAPEAARQTLAMRIAERNRLRELRAERLARLRPANPAAPAADAPPRRIAAGRIRARPTDAAQDALEDFLRALTGGLGRRCRRRRRAEPAGGAALPAPRAPPPAPAPATSTGCPAPGRA